MCAGVKETMGEVEVDALSVFWIAATFLAARVSLNALLWTSNNPFGEHAPCRRLAADVALLLTWAAACAWLGGARLGLAAVGVVAATAGAAWAAEKRFRKKADA